MGDVPEADRPLLLLTTATADRVSDPTRTDAAAVELTKVYPQRTFRFCFTNKQMARAVMDFVMSQDDLRPDVNPVHMVQWDDDSYSHDLTDGFREALPPVGRLAEPETHRLQRRLFFLAEPVRGRRSSIRCSTTWSRTATASTGRCWP